MNYTLEPCHVENKRQTNADRIRAMTDEALAVFLGIVGGCGYSFDSWLNWLRKKGGAG